MAAGRKSKAVPTKEAKIFPTGKKGNTSDGISAPTTDGFNNFTARVGVGQDNLMSAGTYTFNLVTKNRLKLEAAYRGSWVVGVIVDAIADDMTREGIEITTTSGAENIHKIRAAMSRLQIWSSINSVIKWSRLYGGAVGLLDIKGQDKASPLDPATIGKGQFLGIIPYDRWQLTPDLNNVIEEGPNMGLPEYYTITTNNNLNQSTAQNVRGGLRVHHSRLIRLVGIELPFFQAIVEQMWGESVIERLFDRLINFDNATMSTGQLVFKASMRSIKVEGLREIIAAGGKALEGLLSQFDMMRSLQTNEGLSLLDSKDEFHHDSFTFTGLSDVLLSFGQQLSGASEIPLVRFYGQSPNGLNATGEGDLRNYYDSIKAKQEARLRNGVELVLTCLYRSEFGTARPEDMQFTFTPLWQMTAKEKADISKTNAENIAGSYEAGLIDKPTAMEELRQTSDETGIYGNITDESIAEAATEEPPMPGDDPESEEPQQSKPDEKKPAKTGDSFRKKLARWLDGHGWNEGDHPRKDNGEFGSGGGGEKTEPKKEPAKNEEPKKKETTKEKIQREIDEHRKKAEEADDKNSHHEAERHRQKARELEKKLKPKKK